MSQSPNPLLVEHLRQRQRILLFTGAGVSTGSGIADYRGPNGLWKRRQPIYYSEFLNSETARKEYWDEKLESWPTFRDAHPNAVHEAIVQLERAGKLLAVVTQNIDGLHRRAGTSPTVLVELHGTMAAVECQTCGERTELEPVMHRYQETRQPPVCTCGGLLKPAIISFGQDLRSEDLRRATEAAYAADLVIALGSTLSVHPAASIPLLAGQQGTPYIIINRGPTDHDAFAFVTLRLEGDVAELFPPAVAAALAAV